MIKNLNTYNIDPKYQDAIYDNFQSTKPYIESLSRFQLLNLLSNHSEVKHFMKIFDEDVETFLEYLGKVYIPCYKLFTYDLFFHGSLDSIGFYNAVYKYGLRDKLYYNVYLTESKYSIIAIDYVMNTYFHDEFLKRIPLIRRKKFYKTVNYYTPIQINELEELLRNENLKTMNVNSLSNSYTSLKSLPLLELAEIVHCGWFDKDKTKEVSLFCCSKLNTYLDTEDETDSLVIPNTFFKNKDFSIVENYEVEDEKGNYIPQKEIKALMNHPLVKLFQRTFCKD